MESHVINRVRRHLFSLAIFSHGNSCVNRIRRHLLSLYFLMESCVEDIYCCWLYFRVINRMDKLAVINVINRIRRHLLSLAIFSMEIRVINRIRRHLLSLAIFSMESHVINH